MHLKLLTLLISVPVLSAAMDQTITMPKAEVLRDRLSSIGCDHLMEKTTIVQQLAGKEIRGLGVGVVVETILYDYNEYCKEGMPAHMAKITAVQMLMHKPLIIRELLKDHPDIVEELTKAGIL
ncbi:MAG TPA: hypothetical protein PLU71_02195 [Candidatus Dependentiae bacterium]|nr:hypothetical protein [Candidatus Dependentiae bacterium]HRQ62641.1 hypothetical protein [Candidatus Dependentiae bacterium]